MKPWRRNSGAIVGTTVVAWDGVWTMLSWLATYEVMAMYIAAEFDFVGSVEVMRMLLPAGYAVAAPGRSVHRLLAATSARNALTSRV